MLKMPAVRTAVIIFFSSIALEFTCGIWACTYLVNTINISEATASSYLTLYYIGITSSRLISGFISKKFHEQSIVYCGYSIVLVALILLFLPLPITFKAISLFLIGFGNGPTYPNLTYLTPINFGKEISQSIIGLQMAACNVGILLMPPLFGFIAEWLGLSTFPIYLSVLYIAMVVSTLIYSKLTYQLKNQKKS